MKYFIHILLLGLLLNSCYHSIDKPEELIPEEDIVSILTDLYIYKQISSVKHQQKIDYENINGFILQKYEVTPIQFKESYSYYFLDNHKIEEIYNQVKENLNNQLKVLEATKEEL